MKLTLTLLILCLASMGASTYSQTTRFDVTYNDIDIVELFSYLEEKSEFYFFYQKEELTNLDKISVNAKNATIVEVLDKILKGTLLDYRVVDRYVIVRKAGEDRAENSQQPLKIAGKVTDSSGLPLPGVTVVIKGTTQGTITDGDGNYSLPGVPGDGTLVFSFVGLRSQEVPVTGKTLINVVMAEEAIGIEEVVAVGYGTQRKGNITGSISSIKSSELTVAPIASTANTLAGRLPGLISVQSSGLPGADAAQLSIRGFGDALIIVDGIESDFNSIDANQIESISILKDGLASIYGSRAGNGVILVTTKRGIDGKPTISFNTSYSLQGITTMPKPVSAGQYAEMKREEWIRSGEPEETAPFTPEQIQKYYDGTDPLYPNTNWYDELIRSWAPEQQHNLSIRGGSERVKYYGFLGYLDQETIFKTNAGGYKRYNFQSNIDAQVLDNLSMEMTIASTVEDRNYPQTSLTIGEGSVWGYFWNTPPIYPAHLPDPTKVPFADGNGTGGAHVISDRDICGYNDTDNQNLRGSLSLNYSFKKIKGLSAKAFVNYNRNYVTNKNFTVPVELYTYDPASEIYRHVASYNSESKLEIRDDKNRTLTGQLSLNYDNTIGKDHHVSALALYEAIDYKGDWVSAIRKNFLTTSIDQMFAGSTEGMISNGSANEMGRVSFVGRLNYSFRNKYLLETILRADASAKFPKETRWGYFPSISLGWRISEENFLKNLSSLDDLKLRASYGEAGNDNIGNFQYLAGYQLNNYTHILGGGPQNGLRTTGLPNPYLTWEEITTYNAGIDFSFFNRNLYGEADVFYRERNGILANRLSTVPSTFGASLPPENLNSSNDRGFELKLGTAGKNGDLTWDISGNISWSRAKWDHYEEPAYSDSDQVRIDMRSGQWVDRNFGYISDGIFTSQDEIDALTFDQDLQGNTTLQPGDIRYKDINDDGKLDWRDQVEIGKGTTPHWMVGFNTTIKYKNFDLSTLFQGAFGFYHYLTFTQGKVYPSFVFDERWTETNNTSDVLIPRLGGSGSNNYYSDFRYKQAGYLRLKVASLGYNISPKFLKKINISQARIYVSGTNLLTFNRLKDYYIDPEAPNREAGRYYPQQRTISLGANISF